VCSRGVATKPVLSVVRARRQATGGMFFYEIILVDDALAAGENAPLPLCPPQKGHTKRYVLFVCGRGVLKNHHFGGAGKLCL